MKIDGNVIKNPTSFGIERFKITKSGRLSSGLMTMEIIAKKRKFTFSYDVLGGTDLLLLVGLLDSETCFFTFTWDELGTESSCTVYPGAIKYDKFRSDGQEYWKNVKFDLIEQ